MKRLRAATVALGLTALLGLPASEARAGNVTLTITWTGHTQTIDMTSAFAQAGSTADDLTVNTSALNTFLHANGSNFIFSDLGAHSNNPGAPGGATLLETGSAIQNTTSGADTITVVASQTGFTTPTGSGTLFQSSTANYNQNPTGKTTTLASLDTTNTPSLAFESMGKGPNSHSGNNSIAATSGASYSLDNSAEIKVTGNHVGASDQFSVTSTFTSQVIPEPASIVLMLTGALPLVVLGLLRRRRAAA